MSARESADLRMQLIGARAVIADLVATSAATDKLTKSTERQAIASEHAGRRGFLLNQALFTLRRYAYAGTLALTALGGAAIAMGFQFNMSMEENTIAFEQFLGSAQAARTELAFLYNLAAVTPFQFTDVVGATRRFLAFGFTLEETNKYLMNIADTAAAFGASDDMIARMVLVFGQIRASGRLLGQDLLQLQQIGIPTTQILSEKLGIAASEFARVGDLAIPASIAIPALMEGMADRFAGASERQAKTLRGQLSTLKDYSAQLMGTLTLGGFNTARTRIIPTLGKMVGEMQKYASAQQAAGRDISFLALIGIMDRHLGAGGNLLRGMRLLRIYALGFAGVISNSLIPAVRDVAMVYGPPLYVILLAVGQVFNFMGQHGLALRIVLTYLIASFIAARVASAALWWWNFRLAIIWGFMALRALWAGRGIRAMGVALRFLTFWERLYAAATVGSIKGANGQFIAMTRLQKLVRAQTIAFRALIAAQGGYVMALRAASLATITFLLTNPVGWAILLIGALAILYWRWEGFRNQVNDAASDIWRVINAIRTFKAEVAGIPGGNIIRFGLKQGAKALPTVGPLFAGLASGTSAVTRGGAFMVGERGPEIAMLPVGAAVAPVGGGGIAGSLAGAWPDYLLLESTLNLDGQKLAEAQAKYRNDRRARS